MNELVKIVRIKGRLKQAIRRQGACGSSLGKIAEALLSKNALLCTNQR